MKMKNKTILLTITALLLAVGSSAQTAITSQHNGYRDGDKLYRIIADNASPGDRGENCVWELPSINKGDNFIKQTISLRNDSLTVAEGDFLLHYISTDKEVSMRGFQNRGMYSVQDRPLQELRFPFAYGDSISGAYSRKTTYYDMFAIEGEGTSYTVCDGRGVLTDGNETLEDVLRIHHHNTTVSRYNKADGDNVIPVVSEVTEDKYLWYYPGCRYPVMDTRIISCKSNGKTVSDTTFTSLYLPELQVSELAYDDANTRLAAQRESVRPSYGQSGDNNNSETPFPVNMSASFKADGMEILLDYLVAADSDVAFYAYDIAGRLLGHISHASLNKGEHHEKMLIKRRPVNGIVMLTMVAGNMQQVVKVR